MFSCVIITPVPNSRNEVLSNFWRLLLILLLNYTSEFEEIFNIQTK